MDGRMRFPGKGLMIAGVALVVLVGLALFSGCKREQPHQHSDDMPMHDHAAMDQHDHTAMDQAKPVAAEQTTCPVMGGAINKNIFVEYQGKKVYFCCAGCPEAFKADPEKYLAKLPQFQQSSSQ